MLALCPHLVGSLPTESAKQTVAFLSGRGGFTRRQLHDAIIKNPWLLCPGVDKELPALVAVLQKEVTPPIRPFQPPIWLNLSLQSFSAISPNLPPLIPSLPMPPPPPDVSPHPLCSPSPPYRIPPLSA